MKNSATKIRLFQINSAARWHCRYPDVNTMDLEVIFVEKQHEAAKR